MAFIGNAASLDGRNRPWQGALVRSWSTRGVWREARAEGQRPVKKPRDEPEPIWSLPMLSSQIAVDQSVPNTMRVMLERKARSDIKGTCVRIGTHDSTALEGWSTADGRAGEAT